MFLLLLFLASMKMLQLHLLAIQWSARRSQRGATHFVHLAQNGKGSGGLLYVIA